MTYFIKDRKNFPTSTGVYKIGFLNGSGKIYIGSCSKSERKYRSDNGFYKRWSGHINDLKRGSHNSVKLLNAYNKYGIDNMYFEIIEITDSEICLEREQFYIDSFNSCKNGYNCRPKAENLTGFKHSKESLMKKSLKAKERREKYLPEIIRQYENNIPIQTIANNIGVSKSLVSRALSENNLKMEKRGSYHKISLKRFTSCGIFLDEWPSISSCEKSLNINESSIRKVLSGKNYLAGGFHFKKG